MGMANSLLTYYCRFDKSESLIFTKMKVVKEGNIYPTTN